MTANGVRGLSTNARKVEEVVRHCGASGDKRRARCVSQEVTARVRLYRNKLAKMRWFENRREALAISALTPFDQIVAGGFRM
jgi:hypothetical protein